METSLELPWYLRAMTQEASHLVLFSSLAPAISDSGRYEPRSLAKLLGWTPEEMARYLGVSVSTVQKGLDVRAGQPKLEGLASVYLSVLEGFYGVRHVFGVDAEESDAAVAGRARAHATAWLNTPQVALDGKRPKDLILGGNLEAVRDLVADLTDEDDG